MGFSLVFGTASSVANRRILPSAATDDQLKVNSDARGRGERFGPDGTVEKAGKRPDFRSWHFAVVRLEREEGEMNSGENRCRTPELFRRA